MPSPRAVLADIKNFRLDPSKAHSNIRPNGHLAHVTPVLEVKSNESLVVVDTLPVFEETETIVVQTTPEVQPEWASALSLVKDEIVEEIVEPLVEVSVQETETVVVQESIVEEVVLVEQDLEVELEPVTDVLHVEEPIVSKKAKKKKVS